MKLIDMGSKFWGRRIYLEASAEDRFNLRRWLVLLEDNPGVNTDELVAAYGQWVQAGHKQGRHDNGDQEGELITHCLGNLPGRADNTKGV